MSLLAGLKFKVVIAASFDSASSPLHSPTTIRVTSPLNVPCHTEMTHTHPVTDPQKTPRKCPENSLSDSNTLDHGCLFSSIPICKIDSASAAPSPRCTVQRAEVRGGRGGRRTARFGHTFLKIHPTVELQKFRTDRPHPEVASLKSNMRVLPFFRRGFLCFRRPYLNASAMFSFH